MNWFYRVNGQVITRVVSRRVCVCILASTKATNFPSLHPPKNVSDIPFFQIMDRIMQSTL